MNDQDHLAREVIRDGRLPVRTAFTTVLTPSIVHCQPGLAVVYGTGWAWAASADGSSTHVTAKTILRRRI